MDPNKSIFDDQDSLDELGPNRKPSVVEEEPEEKKEEEEVAETKPDEETEDKEETEEEKEEKTPDELEAIRERMNQLAEQVAKENLEKSKVEEKKEESKDEPVDFIGKVDEEEGVSVDQLKSGMSKLHDTVIDKVSKTLEEKLANAENRLQEFVTGIIMGEKFFDANPDLRKYRAFVGMKWQELVNKEPNIGYDKLFENLEEVVRKELNLVKGKEEEPKNGKSKPAPALKRDQGSVSRPGEVKKSPLQAELDELHPFRR